MTVATIIEREELSVSSLCELMTVSRSCHYEKPAAGEIAQRDVEARDATERITLKFPGYGYRWVAK